MKKMLKKIFNKIVNIKKDKLLHFISGLLITQISSVIIILIFHSFYGGCFAGLLIGITIGICKELYDMNNEGHTYEFKDFVITSVGSLIGFLIILSINFVL